MAVSAEHAAFGNFSFQYGRTAGVNPSRDVKALLRWVEVVEVQSASKLLVSAPLAPSFEFVSRQSCPPNGRHRGLPRFNPFLLSFFLTGCRFRGQPLFFVKTVGPNRRFCISKEDVPVFTDITSLKRKTSCWVWPLHRWVYVGVLSQLKPEVTSLIRRSKYQLALRRSSRPPFCCQRKMYFWLFPAR